MNRGVMYIVYTKEKMIVLREIMAGEGDDESEWRGCRGGVSCRSTPHGEHVWCLSRVLRRLNEGTNEGNELDGGSKQSSQVR